MGHGLAAGVALLEIDRFAPRAGHDAAISALRVLVLADTHLRHDLSKLPPNVWEHVEDADVVLHAGDVVTRDLLDALRARRPVHAVLGNNDAALVGALPDRLELRRRSSHGCYGRVVSR